MAVQTVLGECRKEELGLTLTHEHFNLNFNQFYRSPPKIYEDKFDNGFSLDNLAYIRQYPYSSRLNLEFFGPDLEATIVNECHLFSKAGGNTIVENTSWGLNRNLKLMKRVSRETGINVIAGTGHYVAETQASSTLSQTIEELSSTIRKELQEGCLDNPKIRCGFIGEVGSGWPIHEFEKRCIIATGIVQSELDCSVSFHPGRSPEAPAEILRLYSEAGGNLRRTVMSHMDRTFTSKEDLLEFSALGSYCQFDLFGTEVSYYQLCPNSDMPSDAQRIDRIKALIAESKSDKILLSHDIHTRHRLVKYGGHGFGHIPVQVKHHMAVKGIHEEDIETFLVHNPATWLTGSKS